MISAESAVPNEEERRDGNSVSEQSPDGRVAVITGAAAGIGQALAGRLAADGMRIAIADLEPATETLAAIEAAGSEGFAQRCDISDGADVEEFAAAVRERFGRCDVLVANAGVYPIAEFDDWTWEQWRAVMSVNVDSLFHLTKAFLPPMREAGWGRIVAAASNGFYSGLPGLTPYVASKGAVVGFVRSLAGEIGGDGVTINAYAPSLTRTRGTTVTGPHEELGLFDKVIAGQAIPRTQVPEDIAGLVSFLASDAASFITGQTIPVDGGAVHA
jgi:NAD(P)-dependent dehydrogenase (short-subunit alcohol dehydrogenase family)